PHVRVGHRQAPKTKAPEQKLRGFVFARLKNQIGCQLPQLRLFLKPALLAPITLLFRSFLPRVVVNNNWTLV
ncbi:hypothetical protein, partial [Atopomonas hussainii]|uniref:hypothetical protein n=1 Tax=Atopomonas hussainii TaxID=1429083 RepID=UPI001C3129EF